MTRLDLRYRPLRDIPGVRAAELSVALDRIGGGTVVLKSVSATAPTAADLLHEASLLRRLSHPGLVELVDAFVDARDGDGRARTGLATRWIDGEPLPAWADGRGIGERLIAVARVVDTLGYLHRCGWLHLDLKPDNVLGTATGPVVLDLGSARPSDSAAGTAGGTLGYAAPEIIQGEAPAPASDLYSLGVLIYETVAGRSPFEAVEGSALREAVLQGQIIPVRALDPSVPRPLADLLDALMAARPGDRPSDLDEVRAVLAGLVDDLPAPEIGRPGLVGRAREVEDLVHRRLDASLLSAPMVLVGREGIGRSRVAREVLAELHGHPDHRVVDVASTDDPLAALARCLRPEGAPADADAETLLAWARQAGPTVTAFLGRWERWHTDARRQARDVLPELARAGVVALFASERLRPWATPFALGPLAPEQLTTIAEIAGHGGGEDVRALARTSDGLPGLFLDRLTAPAPAGGFLPDGAGPGWRLLAALPDGIPVAAAPALPESVREALAEAEATGRIRRTASRWLFRVVPPPLEAAPDGLGEVAERLVAEAPDADPVWVDLVAARAGRDALAGRRLRLHVDGPHRQGLIELARRLALAGSDEAALVEVDLLLRRRAIDEARERLEALDADLPEVACRWSLLGRSLRERVPGRSPDAWRRTHGWHPQVAAAEAYDMAYFREWEPLITFLDEAREACPEVVGDRLFQAATLILGVWLDRDQGRSAHLDRTLEELEDQHPDGEGLDRLVLHFLMIARRWRGDFAKAAAIGRRVIRAADAAGELHAAIAARSSLASLMMGWGRATEARDLYLQSESLGGAVGDRSYLMRVHASLAELEIRAGRLPAAERHLRRFDEVRAPLGPHREAEVRGEILWAAYDAARGQSRAVVQRLRELDLDGMPYDVRAMRDLYLLESLVELGAYEEALEVAEDIPVRDDPDLHRRVQVARGRIHLALGRFHLQRALQGLPETPDPLERETVGRTYLAAGGEDLDPDTFPARRRHLQRAAELLPDELRNRAIALRERLLEGPGAALEQVVGLIEAMGDGPRLLEGLAKVVADALGAHRVLVMLRMPGLGRQVTAREISGQEAAGLAPEVLRHLQRPDDVWQADDAFADPNLRRMSATVRTFQIRSVLAVAIPRDGRVIGALYIDDLHRSGRFDHHDVTVLQRLARAVGQVAERLPASPPTDGLTVHDVHGIYTCDARQAERMREVFDRFAQADQGNLLITGPTGAGKTWLAHRLATEVLGLRGTVDVVMRPGDPGLLVSQLTGTRRGDFTGAVDSVGAIQRAWAEHKLLFLDEVQNLDEIGQRVLLPLLELPTRRFGPLTGDARPLERTLHVVLGTNADVDNGSWKAVFREDLWFRMTRSRVDLPPLSTRGREAVYRHLSDELGRRELPAPEDVFERGALQRLVTHPWPGNFRTLSDLVDQAAWAFRRDGRPLSERQIDRFDLGGDPTPATSTLPRRSAWDSLQAKALLEALASHDWVQAEAARELDMSKYALHRLLKKLELLDHVREQRQALRQRA